jgi:hypothetical protein
MFRGRPAHAQCSKISDQCHSSLAFSILEKAMIEKKKLRQCLPMGPAFVMLPLILT